MLKALSIALLTLLIALYGTTPAAARDSSAAFAAGTAAFAEERFDVALAHFESALASGLDEPAIHYNIGVCRYKLGLFGEAQAAFAHIVEHYPEMHGIAHYNLGLVALRQNDPERAHDHFRIAHERSQDAAVRYLAGEQLRLAADRDLDVPPAGAVVDSPWFAAVDARVGFDDNVLLLAEDIPLPSGRRAESRFTELSGLVSGPLAESGVRFDGNLYVLRYHEARMFDQAVLQLGLAYGFDIGGWDGEIRPQLSWSSLDKDLLDRRVGIGAQVSRQLMSGTTVGFRYVHDEVGQGDARYAVLKGDRDSLEVRVDRHGERGTLTLSHRIERNAREGPAVSPRRTRWSARYRYDLNADWLLDMRVSRRDSEYSKLVEPRVEELQEIEVGATRTLPDGWLLNASLITGDNASDDDAMGYRRKRFGLGLTKQF